MYVCVPVCYIYMFIFHNVIAHTKTHTHTHTYTVNIFIRIFIYKNKIVGVEGLMMDLEISPDNRFVAAYTNNNQVLTYRYST